MRNIELAPRDGRFIWFYVDDGRGAVHVRYADGWRTHDGERFTGHVIGWTLEHETALEIGGVYEF